MLAHDQEGHFKLIFFKAYFDISMNDNHTQNLLIKYFSLGASGSCYFRAVPEEHFAVGTGLHKLWYVLIS